MRLAFLLYLLAVLSAGAVVLLTGVGETSPLVWMAGVLGALVALAGGAYGRAQVVYAGAAAMLGGFAITLTTGTSDAVGTLAVGLLVWLHVELQLRSIELRPAFRPDVRANLSWLGTLALITGVTVLVWFVAGVIEAMAPTGGLVFRLLAVASVVTLAILVSGIPWLRRRQVFPGSESPGQ